MVRLGSLERDYSLFRGVIPHLVNHFFGVKLLARVEDRNTADMAAQFTRDRHDQ